MRSLQPWFCGATGAALEAGPFGLRSCFPMMAALSQRERSARRPAPARPQPPRRSPSPTFGEPRAGTHSRERSDRRQPSRARCCLDHGSHPAARGQLSGDPGAGRSGANGGRRCPRRVGANEAGMYARSMRVRPGRHQRPGDGRRDDEKWTGYAPRVGRHPRIPWWRLDWRLRNRLHAYQRRH
jgi:hypothetical protein